MKASEFILLVTRMTGSLVRLEETEEVLLNDILRKFKEISWNQFNELLLLCNKDRISDGFFDLFFRELLGIQENKFTPLAKIKKGVEEFRKYAMLGFGNFRFAYRELSKLPKDKIKNRKELKVYLKTPEEKRAEFDNRREKMQGIYPIAEQDTYLAGYISGNAIGIDLGSAILIKDALKAYSGSKDSLSKHVANYVKNKENIKKIEKRYRDDVLWSIPRITEKFFSYNTSATIDDFTEFIHRAISELTPLEEKHEEVLQKAEKNSGIYLTWDYMDVYFATSMRERWEYGTLNRFVRDLFNQEHEECNLKDLNIRYFDPTQSYEKSRIDKGLIEGLMLKRAKCTIYSVQETDTFGKDSELASTLAQGKPVIAYVPEITNETFNKHLALIIKESSISLEFLRDKIRLLSKSFFAPEIQKECLKNKLAKDAKIENQRELWRYLTDFEQKVNDHLIKKAWYSIKTPWALDAKFIKEHADSFKNICNFIAIADKHFYNRRADIFKKHPLGIQINLDTGVANGVLVVRNINDCAKLVYNILTNKINFVIDHNADLGYWYLEEKDISKCIFRVVTDDIKITNSFWNFYFLED